jgi:hypothetical protein
MKKLSFVALILSLCVSASFAMQSGYIPYGVGARFAGMAGAGSALCDDITSAYYNPAGIVDSGRMEFKLGLGAATEGMNEIINTFSKATDPAKFFTDNFNKTVTLNGRFGAALGLNVAKVGISFLPVGYLSINKPAAGLSGNIGAGVFSDAAVTLGYGFSTPGLPFGKLNVGANIKSVNNVIASSVANAATSTSNDNVSTYSGLGFDIGTRASIDTLVMPFSVAIVLKDIGETLKGKGQNITTTYDNAGNITNQNKVEGDLPDLTAPTTMVIGAATTIPVIGLKVALDLDSVASSNINPSYSLMHLGVEYPIVGILAVRAGMVSGGPSGAEISQTTFGAGLNLGFNLNAALMMDGKNSKNNSTIFDLGFAF